jgi:hypothetical protein
MSSGVGVSVSAEGIWDSCIPRALGDAARVDEYESLQATTRLVTRDTRAIVTSFGVRPERCEWIKDGNGSQRKGARQMMWRHKHCMFLCDSLVRLPLTNQRPKQVTECTTAPLMPGLSKRISVVTFLIHRFASMPLCTSHTYRNFSLTFGFFG